MKNIIRNILCRSKILILALVFTALCPLSFVLHAETSTMDAIKKQYAGIVTMEARFQQKIFILSMKRQRDFEGEFFYKRQKGFLWHYTKPKEKYFLYDGKNIYQGEEEKPFIIKDKVNKEKTAGTFLDLIDDISKLDEFFDLKQQGREGNMELLELSPKKDSTIKSARVWIDKQNRITKMELVEFTGNVNTMEFSSIKTNNAIDDGNFMFKPDKQKEVIER
jgi:chaperone LolA